MLKIKKCEAGFSLIELLLISAILLLAATSGLVIFRSGRNMWNSADKGSETIQNAVIGMEKVEREIKNSPGLTKFSNSVIRFKILREDANNPGSYIKKYAIVKRNGDYLKYGERDADSDNEAEWTLNDLAYPVTNLSFSFLKSDGSSAVPGVDDPGAVKSVLINMTASEGGVTIPLSSRVYLVMGTATNFDGTPSDGTNEHHFNEGNDETVTPPPPGSKGDGVKGWSLSDYAVYGDKAVSIANSVQIDGNVGTRNLSGSAFNSANSSEIYGYLMVKGSLNMSNSGAISGDAIAAGCVTPSSYSTKFANSAKTNSHLWTLRDITMSNSSRINGTVYQLEGATITCRNSSGYDERVEISEKPTFMKDPLDEDVEWGDSVFPKLPPAEDLSWLPGGPNLNYASQTATMPPGDYGNVNISNSSRITINPGSSFTNFSVSNSSYVYMASGDYYFNRLSMSNSSKMIFDFAGGSIRLFVRDTVSLSNSSSFQYDHGGDNDGADLLYLEAVTWLSN